MLSSDSDGLEGSMLMVLQDQCCGFTDKEVSDSCNGQRSGPLYVLVDAWIRTIAAFFS